MSDRTRTRILNALKAGGPQTAAELAASLSVTPVAVRQHLDGLLQEELVGFEDMKGAVGRPRRFWELSAAGHARFPDNHSALILSLLSGLRELHGAQGVDDLIAFREKEMQASYEKELSGVSTLSGRLSCLADLRNREGYMAEVERDVDGSWLFIENHCSICAAASVCQGLCRSELSLFASVLGSQAEIERCEHLLSGGRRCVYRIRERAAA